MDELLERSATELLDLLRARELSSVALVGACLQRIEERNPEVNAFVTVLADDARAAARRAEQELRDGAVTGPLHGLPVAIKDLDDKAGVSTTFGVRPLSGHVATASSVHVERLERAGAIVVGKTNTPEFGHKGVTDNLLVGPARNPFDLSRNAGGSSGGSAAAVADRMVPVATGTDGGGSVRIPAAACHVVGLKPTYGRIPDPTRPDAFLTLAPFQHVGTLARSVEDAARLLVPMVGPHPRDPMSLPPLRDDLVAAAQRPAAGLRAAFSPDWGDFPIDPEVARVVAAAVDDLVAAGIDVTPVAMDLGTPQSRLCDTWLDLSGLICVDVFDGLAARGVDLVRDHRDELPDELLAMVERGRALSVPDLKRDQVVRSRVLDAIEDVFATFDLLLTPTLAVPPVPNADDGRTVGPSEVNGVPVDPLLGWCLTYPLNFTGHPAASVPAGLTAAGLPVGLQIIGRRFDEATVVAACAALERVRPWRGDYPSA